MLRRIALGLIAATCALAGAWTGLRLVGPATYGSTLGDVELRVALAKPSERGIDLYVPLADWGLRAAVTAAPVKVAAEPRRIARAGVVQTVTGGGEAALRVLRSQLDEALTAASLRAGAGTLGGGVAGGLLALLLWHVIGVRGRRLALAPLAGLAVTVAAGGGLALWATATWDPQRLERPTYYASGTELQRLLEQADQLRRTGERYSDRVDLAIRSIAGLLDDRGAPAQGPGLRAVLASDIHNNLLTLPTVERFSAGHPAFLTGDFTINGSRMEASLLQGLEDLGEPVVAVSGNHDSPGLMRRFARRGIIVLTHRGRLGGDGRVRGPAVQEIAGLTVAGFEDPLQYQGGDFPDGVRAALSFGDFPDGHERFLDAIEERWRWWRDLPERPDVLLVHQEAIGRALAHLIFNADPEGAPLAILSGHTHRQRLDRIGPVTVVNSGSAGAGGIFGAGRDDVGLALLDFTEAGALEASDLVRMNPLSSAASARRVITGRPDCDEELVFCAEEPVLPEIPSLAVPDPPSGPGGPATR